MIFQILIIFEMNAIVSSQFNLFWWTFNVATVLYIELSLQDDVLHRINEILCYSCNATLSTHTRLHVNLVSSLT